MRGDTTSRCRMLVAAVLPLAVLMSFQWNSVVSFAPSIRNRRQRIPDAASSARRSSSSTDSENAPASIDVSDLGLTLEDLEKPIPSELLGDFKVTASGIQSTSRVESVDDEGCMWEESADLIGAKLSIEGLRGQPVAAMEVAFSTTTCTVTVFGYAVWSCLLKGECLPDSAVTKIEDGYDMTPLITLSVAKKKDEKGAPLERWNGFIGSIGEDSIL